MDSRVSAVGSVQLPFVGDTALGNTRAVLCEMCAGDDGEERNSMIASSQVLCVRFSTAKRDGAGDENMRWERRKKRRSESKAEPTDRQI